MSAAIDVRPAVEADIPRILEIERESEAAAHFSEADYKQALMSEMSGVAVLRIVLVAASESAQGVLVARFLHAEWEIENVAVAQPARRLGLGERLVNAFLQSRVRSVSGKKDRSAEAPAVFLEVRTSNVAARALYEKIGFTVAGHRTAYYRNPDEDAVLYRYSFQ
jgi:ribosomal-protein-alanine N-acetyltransferase